VRREARRSKLGERTSLDTLLGKQKGKMGRYGGARAFSFMGIQLNMSALVLSVRHDMLRLKTLS